MAMNKIPEGGRNNAIISLHVCTMPKRNGHARVEEVELQCLTLQHQQVH